MLKVNKFSEFILEKKLYPINNICQDYLPEQK
jgi:hypothetical protein